jgi:endonuclease/exonuclease/phosphatase (EEP) superfamily protein YafD
MRRTLLLAWLALAGLSAIWVVLAVLGDRVWWALPVLFGPRWIWGAAIFGALPALFHAPRKATIPAALMVLIFVFGVMDVRLGLHRLATPAGTTIRVMELNADGDHGSAPRIVAAIREYAPEVAVIAECGPVLKHSLARMAGFHLHTAITSLCLLSRGAVLEWAERDPRNDVWQEGGSGATVRAMVSTPAGPVRIGLVHLETPRDALQMYVDKSEILKQGPATRANMAQREKESSRASSWIDQGDAVPTIIAGDFNLPIESAIYRRYWGRMHNAFSETGFGTGHTKHTRLFGARIDHILSVGDVVPVGSFLGRDVGSDHVPLIADLVVRPVSGPAVPGSR